MSDLRASEGFYGHLVGALGALPRGLRRTLPPERLDQRRRPSVAILMICMLSGCSTVNSVKRMDDNLGAIRPKIEELTTVRERLEEVADRTAALQQTTVQMAATLDSVRSEMGELSNRVTQLSTAARALEPVAQKLDLVNQELEHLSRVREGITDVQRSLGKLHDLGESVDSINRQVGHLNDQLSDLRGSMVVVTARLERLDSIDARLVLVDDSIRKLHGLVPMVAFAVPLLALWIASSIYSQWLTHRQTRLENAQHVARSQERPSQKDGGR